MSTIEFNLSFLIINYQKYYFWFSIACRYCVTVSRYVGPLPFCFKTNAGVFLSYSTWEYLFEMKRKKRIIFLSERIKLINQILQYQTKSSFVFPYTTRCLIFYLSYIAYYSLFRHSADYGNELYNRNYHYKICNLHHLCLRIVTVTV